MAFKVFQSNQNQLKLTDEFLIYDKDKFIDLKELFILKIKGDKSPFVSKFDPWADLTKHFELSKDYMDKVGPEMAPPPNEPPFRKDSAKMIAGCVFVLAIAFVLFLIFFLFVN